MSQSISSPSIDSLSQAAQAICKVLDKHGYRDGYMFAGKAAQCIYMRNSLSPSTLEIVFLKQAPTASLKQLIHNLNPNNFAYTGNEGAQKKLQWRSPVLTTSTIEVVFLEPLPAYLDARIHLIDHYPLASFPCLLLHSLLAWHCATRMADRSDFSGQVSAMLQFLQTRPDLQQPIASNKNPRSDVVPIVERFYFNYPVHLEEWKALGFLPTTRPPSSQYSSKHPQKSPMPKAPTSTLGSTISKPKQSTTISTRVHDVQHQPDLGTTVTTTATGQAASTASRSQAKKRNKKRAKRAALNSMVSDSSANGNHQQASKPPGITALSAIRPSTNTPRIAAFPTVYNTTSDINALPDPPERVNTEAENVQQPTPQCVTPQNIHSQAAQTTVSILRRMRFTSALFGDMARNVYGNPGSPNDIDLLVVPPPSNSEISQEGIKHLLFEHCPNDSHFVLLDNNTGNVANRLLYWVPGRRPMPKIIPAPQAKNPTVRTGDDNAAKELARRISSITIHDSDGGRRVVKVTKEKTKSGFDPTTNQALHPPNPKAIKINIFLPGTMNLPDIPASMITHIGPLSLPCVPYPLLLALTLQEWSHNKILNTISPWNKDLADLEWLLGSEMNQDWNEYKESFGLDLENRGRENGVVGVWRDRRLFNEDLEKLTRERVREICREHPEMSKRLLEVGLQAS